MPTSDGTFVVTQIAKDLSGAPVWAANLSQVSTPPNAGLRSGYSNADPITILSGQFVSGIQNVYLDQNAFSTSGWIKSGNLDVYTNLKVSLKSGEPPVPVGSGMVSGVYNLMFDQAGFTISGYQQSGTVIVFNTVGSTTVQRLGGSQPLLSDYNLLSGAIFGPVVGFNKLQDTGLTVTLGNASGSWQLTCDTTVNEGAGGGTPTTIDAVLWDDTASGPVANSFRQIFFEPALGTRGAISGATWQQTCTFTLIYKPTDGGANHVIRLLAGNDFTGHGLLPTPTSLTLLGNGHAPTFHTGSAEGITVLSYELV